MICNSRIAAIAEREGLQDANEKCYNFGLETVPLTKSQNCRGRVTQSDHRDNSWIHIYMQGQGCDRGGCSGQSNMRQIGSPKRRKKSVQTHSKMLLAEVGAYVPHFSQCCPLGCLTFTLQNNLCSDFGTGRPESLSPLT